MLVTPESLEAAYNFLLTTKPFRSWKLPDAEDIEFHVLTSQRVFGDYLYPPHQIRVSVTRNARTDTYLCTIAHEIAHLYQSIRKLPVCHNAEFKRLAKSICRWHGWDVNTF